MALSVGSGEDEKINDPTTHVDVLVGLISDAGSIPAASTIFKKRNSLVFKGVALFVCTLNFAVARMLHSKSAGISTCGNMWHRSDKHFLPQVLNCTTRYYIDG